MISMDMRTLVFGNVVTDIVCLLVIILLWQQSRQRFAGMIFWVIGFFFTTVALFLVVLRGSIPDWASMVMANTLVIIGVFLGYIALLKFTEKKGTQIHNYVFMVFFVFVHAYFTFVQPDQVIRNFNISLGMLIICFQCAWLMLYRVPINMRPLTRVVGLVFCGYCLVSIVRIVDFFTGAHLNADYFHSGVFEKMILVSYQVLFILLTYSLALMVNKRLHIEITKQEEKFSKAFHSSPYAFILSRLSDGQIIEVNDGFVRISDHQYADIKGKTSFDLHLWDREEDRTAVVDEISKGGKLHEREFQFRKKSGDRLTGLFSAELITINNEKCLMSSINDITDRKKAEEALHETRDYLENLLNYAHAPIIIWDSQFRITKFNKAFELLSGRNAQEALGQEVAILFPESQRKQSLEYVKKASTGDRWEVVEIEIQHVDGSVRTLLWNSAAIYSPDGKILVSTIAQGQDITDRKRAQEVIYQLNAELGKKVDEQTDELHTTQNALLNLVDDMAEANKKVAAANTALDAVNKELASFSYSVSHDLRAPLRSIDGFSQALIEDYSDKTLDKTGKSYLERIRQGTQNMGGLIDDMLNLSRITQTEFNRESVDLSKMVQDIIDTYEQKNTASPVTVRIQQGLVIESDPNLMNIALTNLLSNAWKFAGKKKNPQIEFGMTLKDGKEVFFVRDNGVGFDMAYVGKLFGAFQRLHRIDEFPGTGIGLATVQRIIHRHGGRIWAESEVGKGATFYFTLS